MREVQLLTAALFVNSLFLVVGPAVRTSRIKSLATATQYSLYKFFVCCSGSGGKNSVGTKETGIY